MSASATLGYLLSFLYERFTWKWHGKDLKKVLFFVICMVAGGYFAIINQGVLLFPLSWETTPDIFKSVLQILQWGVGFVVAGQGFFDKWVHKKT